MDETALLTDDEIVAICAADGRPWPLGLTTVPATAEDLAHAGMRGMRSLMVRRLTRWEADSPGARPHEMIARDVAAFLDSDWRVGAYLAPAGDHSVLGGASITAARTPDGWILDTATAAGVHALRQASADEAMAAILDLAEKAYAGTLLGSSAALVCVVRYGENTVAIGSGSCSGVIDGSDVTEWDPALVRGAFAA